MYADDIVVCQSKAGGKSQMQRAEVVKVDETLNIWGKSGTFDIKEKKKKKEIAFALQM